MMNPNDKTGYQIKGFPAVYRASDPEDPSTWVELFADQNVITDGMHSMVTQLLLRNFEQWQPAAIIIGSGGDYDQPASPGSTVDTGAKVPPLAADTYVRVPLFTAPIVQVEDLGMDRVSYVAIARPHEAQTAGESPAYINELGLVTENGTLIAHYVTDAIGGGPNDGRATQFVKGEEYLIVRWTVEFVVA